MKKIILITSCVLITNYCIAQKLKITLHNKTGYEIDSVVFCNQKIGLLKKDTTITLLNIKYLVKQDGYFQTRVFCYIKGKQRNKNDINTGHCGTGAESIEEGHYSFDIL